jgi:hypothetical protein
MILGVTLPRCRQLNLKQNLKKANHSQWHKVEVKPTNIVPKRVVKEILTLIIAALATQPCPND